jgi:YD repeat-containing protein
MSKKIKSITLFKNDLISHRHSPEESDPKGYKYSYSEMDESGHLLLEVKFNDAGELEEKDVYTFDNEGKLKEEISFLSDEEIAEHKTYEYDSQGLVQQVFKHYADGSKDTIQYEYDGNGNVSVKTTTDSEDEIEAKEIFEWDNKNLIRKEVYEFDELKWKEINTYDTKGNRIEVSKWSQEDGNSRTEIFFNDQNDIVKTLEYNNDNKLVSKTIYTYDEKARLANAVLYDERGNAIEQTETNASGEINNRAVRKFNDANEVVETSVYIDLHGKGLNQEYLLHYEYEYFEN